MLDSLSPNCFFLKRFVFLCELAFLAAMCGEDAEPPRVRYRTPRCLAPSAVAVDGNLVVEPFPVTFNGYTYSAVIIHSVRF